MIVALAAGALVLAVTALAVAVVERRARTSTSSSAAPPAGPVPVAEPVATPDEGQAMLRVATDRAERAERLLAIGDALGRAVAGAEFHEVVGRSLARVAPGRWSELLLADPTEGPVAAVRSVARSAGPAGELAGCPVPTIDRCPSARRAQPLLAGSSTEVDACLWLADRPGGDCSALCVPVAVDARVVGVLHVLGPPAHPVPGDEVSDVIWLAGRVGERLGEAAGRDRVEALPPATDAAPAGAAFGGGAFVGGTVGTEAGGPPAAVDLTDASLGGPPPLDVLTGLPGRATLVRAMESLRSTGTPFVVVAADVDGLAAVNARSGHAAGDVVVSALASAFARGLGVSAVVARVDGATLAAACPDLTLGRSVEAIELIRSEVLDLVADGDTVAFTCSFGITHSSVADEVDDLLRVARVGLERAQELGGDQIVYADLTLADEPPQSPG